MIFEVENPEEKSVGVVKERVGDRNGDYNFFVVVVKEYFYLGS